MPVSQLDIISGLGGKLMPAHVLTPFKSFYGNCYDRLYYAFKDKFDRIPAVELGLSSDTNFADTIGELSGKTFLSNSDAHSIEKIAREYNRISLKAPDFENLFDAVNDSSEMNVLHHAKKQELADVVGEAIASNIILSRQGLLQLQAGGGGHYGKIII
jgi:PHP family Zn ribbon phosphoesterase